MADVRSASLPRSFNRTEIILDNLQTGDWVVCGSGLGNLGKGKCSCSYRESKGKSSAVQPVAGSVHRGNESQAFQPHAATKRERKKLFCSAHFLSVTQAVAGLGVDSAICYL